MLNANQKRYIWSWASAHWLSCHRRMLQERWYDVVVYDICDVFLSFSESCFILRCHLATRWWQAALRARISKEFHPESRRPNVCHLTGEHEFSCQIYCPPNLHNLIGYTMLGWSKKKCVPFKVWRRLTLYCNDTRWRTIYIYSCINVFYKEQHGRFAFSISFVIKTMDQNLSAIGCVLALHIARMLTNKKLLQIFLLGNLKRIFYRNTMRNSPLRSSRTYSRK